MVSLIPFSHSLSAKHLSRVDQHQSNQSLRYFTKPFDDYGRSIIMIIYCDHIDKMSTLTIFKKTQNEKNEIRLSNRNRFLEFLDKNFIAIHSCLHRRLIILHNKMEHIECNHSTKPIDE
jgi:hypothetical protein